MTKQAPPITHRTILQDEFDKRTRANPNYSLRAFARDLQLSASRLSEVLSGKQGLSRAMAARICTNIGWAPDDSELFCDLVDMHHARSQAQRDVARERVERQRQIHARYNQLELDQFRIISEWYHLTILELFHLKSAEYTTAWIAGKLSISLPEASAAVDRLIRIGLLKRAGDGTLQPVHQVNATAEPATPSTYIRSYHRRMLQKAQNALEQQPMEQRSFSTLSVSIKLSDLPKAREKIRQFWQNFCEELNCESNADSVYCLSTQFFSLTTNEPDP